MSYIQKYPAEWTWVTATLNRNPGSFVQAFCEAALAADPLNYEILRPAVLQLMEKYPLHYVAS